jgi:formylglycine-generating enzyme required for sulfatase activity
VLRRCAVILSVASFVLFASSARADSFGTGVNEFALDFVPISGATNPTSGYGIVNHDYRMGTYEITNDQWNKFVAAYGPVTGSQGGYHASSIFAGLSQPTDDVSWFEAAQFVNWLNTSTNHQAAYNFTGTQGTGDYTFAPWIATDPGYDASNPFRNTNAFYFLPTEDEWVKAAYWNGTALQTYATKAGESLTQGDGISGTGWNFYTTHYATMPFGPWNVGRGSQDLNGTYDMMGNASELMESPYTSGDYGAGSSRGLRGGDWSLKGSTGLDSSDRHRTDPTNEGVSIGFRVASVPEPASLAMLLAGAIAVLIWRRRRK